MGVGREDILGAGRAIRAFLPDLYSSQDAWQRVDDELAEALNLGDELVAAERVQAVLEDYPETAQWWTGFQQTGFPPGLDVRRGASSPVAGAGEVVAAPMFTCPYGDFTWPRRSAARPIPLCRTHQVRLIPAAGAPW